MTRSLCIPRPIAALLLLGAMVFGTSTAFAQKADGLNASLSVSPAFEDGTSRASLGGQNLVVDDGGPEDSIGLTAGGTFLWLNRFTPPAGDFPLQLISADVHFTTAGGFPAGSTFDVFVWSDADGDPGNGATLVGSATGNTVGVLDVFQTVTFSSPIAIATVGDVLIGARVTHGAGQFPAAIDQTSPQVRSWAGFGAGADTTPPTLPTATFGTIDSFGLPGNWLIRGTYVTGGAGGFVTANPSSVDFGNVDVGTSSTATTITLSNPGTDAATISSITASSGFSVDLAGTDLTLGAGESTTFTVTFSPTTLGDATGSVTITHDGVNTPTTVALEGRGTDPNATTFEYCAGSGATIGPDLGPFSVYPITVSVPAPPVGATVTDVNVRLEGMNHTWPSDIDVFVEHPLGPTVVLLADNGGSTDITSVDLTFDDEGTALPAVLTTGAYIPQSTSNASTWPAPAPVPTEGALLGAFDGANPAGDWTIWGVDDANADGGDLSDACVIIEMSLPQSNTISMAIVRQPAAPLPASGGDARVAFMFTNLTNDAITTSTWAELELPGGGFVSIPGNVAGLMRPKDLILTPAGQRRWGLRFVLAAAAPAGEYRYTRYAGTPNGPVEVAETVSFFKAAAATAGSTSAIAPVYEMPEAGEAVVAIGEGGALTLLDPGTMEAPETQATITESALRVSPNPVTTQGQVVLSVATSQAVRVALYDALGREVRVLLDRSLTAGQEAHIGFRTADLPAGVYVIRATGTDVSLAERITVVR